MAKIKVGIIFGGRSGEHEISVRSAQAVYRNIDKSKYEVVLIGVDRNGNWQRVKPDWFPRNNELKGLEINNFGLEVVNREGKVFVDEQEIDVFFPLIHGTYGEDGRLQGYLDMLDAAYVGAGVGGSYIGMDKDVAKRLLRDGGIPVGEFTVVYDGELKYEHKEFVQRSGYPVFVKPARLGSSVGVFKVKNDKELEEGVARASKYDRKVMIEQFISGREIEVGVVGNKELEISVPGEIVVKRDFYDYEAKYIDAEGAMMDVPAKVSLKVKEKIKDVAGQVYRCLECVGMARIDMFLVGEERIVVNEINTIPGMTSRSMFPVMFEESGISFKELIDKLIQLAIERKNIENV